MAESAEKITSADIRRDPTRFIARTMITAVITAIRRLYLFDELGLDVVMTIDGTDHRIAETIIRNQARISA